MGCRSVCSAWVRWGRPRDAATAADPATKSRRFMPGRVSRTWEGSLERRDTVSKKFRLVSNVRNLFRRRTIDESVCDGTDSGGGCAFCVGLRSEEHTSEL